MVKSEIIYNNLSGLKVSKDWEAYTCALMNFRWV
jgi:hypothetical protein